MTKPDAEVYLRCRLEDQLMSGRRQPNGEPDDLLLRVRASLAVAAVTEDVALAVLADAERAHRLRDAWNDLDDNDDDDHKVVPPRVVVCPTRIEQPWGSFVLTNVVLGEQETSFEARGTLTEPVQNHPPHFPGRHQLPWDGIDVVDAAGVTHTASYSGGSSDASFEGEFSVYPALDPYTPSITIAGHTVDLTVTPAPRAMRVDSLQSLSPADRARRHLSLISGLVGYRHRGDNEAPARETFEALGLGDLPAVVDDAAPARRPAKRRRRIEPRERWVALGVTTPRVDGLVITVVALSDAGRLSYLGTQSGALCEETGEPAFRIGAVDDHGAQLAVEPAGSGSIGRGFHGSVVLTPLAENATSLTIVIDTLRHRVEIDVPLDWQDVP